MRGFRPVLLLLFVLGSVFAVSAQDSSSTSGAQVQGVTPEAAPASEPAAPGPEVTAAEASIAGSDWKAAATKLDTWLVAHPKDPRALFDAGYVADAQNRLDDAVGLYRRAIDANPKSFEAHLSLGLLLARQGKPAEARPELLAATTLDPGEAGPALKARAWRALAQIDRPTPGSNDDEANSVPDTSAASNDLLQALRLTPETPQDTMLAATLAEESHQFEAAEGAYRQLIQSDPKNEQANTGLAHVLIEQKKYDEAETALRTALEKLPDDPPLTAQLATVLAAENKAEALPLLQKLHAQHPENKNVTSMLAEVTAESGDYAAADALTLKLLADDPRNPDLLAKHGQNLVLTGKFPEAVAVFNKATEIDPANADAWSGLAFCASKTGQHELAIHALTMRSKFLPENASTYFLWATSYDALHERAQAVAYYHHFLDASAGKNPTFEWQARQRLALLEKKP